MTSTTMTKFKSNFTSFNSNLTAPVQVGLILPLTIACRQNQKMSQIKLRTLPFSHNIQILMIGTIGTSGTTRYYKI